MKREINSANDAALLLQGWDDIVILSHRSPDGDTVGSATALYYALTQLGKRVSLCCSDPIPQKYNYMYSNYIANATEEGYIVAVDIADEKLFGDNLSRYVGKVDLCVDHHRSSNYYAKYNFVDNTAPATCQLIYDIVVALSCNITPPIANSLYTGIVTDTGCFRYPSTTAKTHMVAAHLIECGAEYSKINREMFESKSKGRIFVERYILNTMEFLSGNRIAVIDIPLSIVNESGAGEGELDGLSAIPKTIVGVDVAITINERGDNEYKISLRTNTVDASAVCREFSGGGHARAAGCTIFGEFDEVKAKIIAAVQAKLDG